MRPEERDQGALLDIVLACRDIEELTAGWTEERFLDWEDLESKRTRYAVMHQIQVIGEAVKRLSGEFREEHSEIPWRSIAGMRDRLIHVYDDVNHVEVWRVASEEVPALRGKLERLIPPRKSDGAE